MPKAELCCEILLRYLTATMLSKADKGQEHHFRLSIVEIRPPQKTRESVARRKVDEGRFEDLKRTYVFLLKCFLHGL